jgi:hypothetical protein
MANEGNYRDELAAAHARIAELEEKLAEVTRSSEEAAAPCLAELEAERARAIAEAKANSPSRSTLWTGVVGIVVAIAIGMGLGAFTRIPWTDVPFVCAFFAFIPALVVVVAWTGPRALLKQRLAKIDEKIADTKCTAAIALAASSRVRVAGEQEADTLEIEEEQSARRARR